MNPKIIIYSFLLLFITVAIGCDGNVFDKDEGVKIRIENSSEFYMENITVSFPNKDVSYGNLEPGSTSDFIEVEKAYRYAYIETEIEGERAALVPIDYVGEKLLDSGKYTYQLFVAAESDSVQEGMPRYYLGIEFKKN